MSISISTIFKDLSTEKYNKGNMIILISLISLCGIIYYIPFILPNAHPSLILLTIISWIFYTLFVGGYLTLISHNEAHSKKQVIPSIKEIGSLLKNGFFYGIGNFLLAMIISLAICIPALVFGVIFAMIMPILMTTGTSPNIAIGLMIGFWILVLFVSIALYYLLELPNILNFLVTLNFCDFFNFKKGIKFRKQRNGHYNQFIFIHIFLSILTFIIPFVSIILGIIYFKDSQTTVMILSGITTILGVILFVILMPNLNGQIIKMGPLPVKEEVVEYEYEEDEDDE